MRAAIIGLYNSGSSVLSRIVENLGAEIGRPLWESHYESKILKEALAEWWAVPRLEEQVAKESRMEFLKWWAEYHESRNPVVCAKHPLLCLSAFDLDRAWGEDYKAIRASRPLAKSIERLKLRGWYEEPERMQRRLYQSCEQYFENKEHLSIEYDDLLSDPVGETRRIAEYLGLDSSDDNVSQAASVVRTKVTL